MDVSDVVVVLLTVLVGVGAGILSALLGVGGAVITTPAVRVLGATPIQAVGSTVPAILPGAIAGALRYAKEGLVDWTAAFGLGIAGAVFAVGGALLSDHVDARLLMVFTALLMLWSGTTVVRGGARRGRSGGDDPPSGPAATLVAPAEHGVIDEVLEGVESSETDTAMVIEHEPGESHVHDQLPIVVALGAAAGFLAGLLGVGGGIIMVPVLTGPLRVPMRSAVASSLVAVAVFSIPALVTHWVLGHIDWSLALPLMIGVVPGARIGAHITIGSSERTIRLLFGVFIVILALVYGASEAAALF